MRIDLFYRKLKGLLLESAGEAAAYEAKEIIGSVLALRDSEMAMIPFLGREISEDACKKAEALAARRNTREPLEYILGKAWFFGLCFDVTPACLIPQADTEIVCDKLISKLKNGDRFADICTGSGCIALAALANTKNTVAVGYDISERALTVAKHNAEKFGLRDRFSARIADVFSSDFLCDDEPYDVIVSNPPYIETAVIGTLSPEVQAEPHIALDGGADGLDFYRRLLDVCPLHIKKGGVLLLEIGYDQKDALKELCLARQYPCEFYRDFGGNNRVCAVFI
jgi:release factor glutamine methyltransferase